MRNVREMGYIKGWRGLTKAVWRRGRLPETDRGSKSPADLAEMPLMLFPLAGL